MYFIYTGQVTIQKDEFKGFLEIREKFKISGLSNDENFWDNIHKQTSDTSIEVPIKSEQSEKNDSLEKL